MCSCGSRFHNIYQILYSDITVMLLNWSRLSCLQPRCGMNRLPSSECTTITWNGAQDMLNHTYVCRCRRHEECTSGALPTAENPTVIRSCERLPTSTIVERRRRRSILRQLRGNNSYPWMFATDNRVWIVSHHCWQFSIVLARSDGVQSSYNYICNDEALSVDALVSFMLGKTINREVVAYSNP